MVGQLDTGYGVAGVSVTFVGTFIVGGGGDWIDIVDFKLTETPDADSNLKVNVDGRTIVSGTRRRILGGGRWRQ